MDFISEQKEFSFHKNYICDDFTDMQAAIGFCIE